MERWTPETQRGVFLAAVDAEVAKTQVPARIAREYNQLIRSLNPFDFEKLVATLVASMGYQDVSTLTKGGDEGIDVLGRYNARLFTINVGIQCKHSRRYDFVVGRPVLDRLRAAVQPYRCQVGMVFTNARFSKDALAAQVAYDKYTTPVRCIDGDLLRNLLYGYGIGLRESGGERLVDPEVWAHQFNAGNVRNVVSTVFVPQADKLHLVRKVVDLVHEGCTTNQDIAREIGYAGRQGHYYALAAQALGLVQAKPGERLSLTPRGHRLLLVAGDVGATKAILREGIREIPVYDRMLQFLKERKGEPISLTSLTSAFATESGLTGTTPRRRLTTMLGWFQELGFIEREGNDVYFKRSP